MELNKENLQVLPLALYGIAKGVGQVILKPFIQETAKTATEVLASITYYNSQDK